MSEQSNEPSPSEWKVLKVVWDEGPLSTGEVLRALEDEGWSDSTIKTLLRRLTDKGMLRARRAGRGFRYNTARRPLKALLRSGEALLERAGDAATAPLLAHLVQRGKLSQEDLDGLRDLIDRLSDGGER